MAVMILAAAVAAASLPRLARADPVGQWDVFIAEAATKAGIPSAWIGRVMRAESGGRIALGGRLITSRTGAMGLMQLMPATWSDLRAELGLGRNPFDPHDNILAGAVFLRKMYDRFGYPGLFGAYNAGPRLYSAHLRGAALPAETQAYLVKVAGTSAPQAVAGASARPTIFVRVSADISSGAAAQDAPGATPALFVSLHDPREASAERDSLFVGK